MLRHHLISRSIGRSFDRSYEVARGALVTFKPHAVVGFSWGGALAVRLSNDGAYDGPMLLLAPAHAAIERMVHRPVSRPVWAFRRACVSSMATWIASFRSPIRKLSAVRAYISRLSRRTTSSGTWLRS